MNINKPNEIEKIYDIVKSDCGDFTGKGYENRIDGINAAYIYGCCIAKIPNLTVVQIQQKNWK